MNEIEVAIVIVYVSLGIMLLLGLFATIEVLTLETVGHKQVPCYDEFENEIEGLECIEEIKCGLVSKAIVSKAIPILFPDCREYLE